MALRRRRKRSRRQIAEINVVPYIDVMLVLLIIFMVTTPLLTHGVKVNLPQAAAKTLPPEQNQPIIVTVNQTGQYFINILRDGKTPVSSVEIERLVHQALQKAPKRKVYVRGDRSVNYGKVVQAMVLLQQAGVPTVGLMTQDKAHQTS